MSLHFLYKGFSYFYSLKQMYDLLHLSQYYLVDKLKAVMEDVIGRQNVYELYH